MRFDHLYTYDELHAAVASLAEQRPDLMTVETIGRSYEGREVVLATVTNTSTGPHDEKPAVWVDANIHATEVTGSTAALHLLYRLVTGYGVDERVTRALDTRVFYVLPRVNPDGVELALAAKPTYLRSSTRKWPRTDDADGLVEGDVDGDGRILTMRVPDPNGAWRVSDRDPRLLVPRRPDDPPSLPYYRVLREGTIRNYDGVLVPYAPERRALDLNRNFPAAWKTDSEQHGAGPYPVSEPEVRNLVDALVARPNVCAYFAYHTYSAVNLRPYDDRPDDKMPPADLERYKKLGEWGKELTGYDAISVYHDFRYGPGPDDVITGAADTWAYEHLGCYGWTTEFWSPLRAAGITPKHLIGWFEEHPLDDDLALLRWNDEQLGGRGFVDWYSFDHPQLGPVELGGWDMINYWYNPPFELLEREVAPHADWVVFHALASPLLRVRSFTAAAAAPDVHRVRLVVQNAGWLPTAVTKQALEGHHVGPVVVELELPRAAKLLAGRATTEVGQLEGRVAARSSAVWWSYRPETDDRALVEWLVEAPPGSVLKATARHARAGTVRAELTLE